MDKNKYLESIIKWLTSLLGNELFMFYLVEICICLESRVREKGIGDGGGGGPMIKSGGTERKREVRMGNRPKSGHVKRDQN